MRFRGNYPHPSVLESKTNETTFNTASTVASSIDSLTQSAYSEDSISLRFESLLQALREKNPTDVALGSVKTLTSILSNVVSFPKDAKYRVIKLSNKTIQSKILETHGALELLLSVGFVKQGEEVLELPMSVRIMEYAELIMILNKTGIQLEIDQQAAKKLTTESSAARPAADFDPFKPSIFRAAIQPRGGKSETEERLVALQEKQRSIEGDIPADLETFRSTQVMQIYSAEIEFQQVRFV